MALQNGKINSEPSQHGDSRGLADRLMTSPQRKGVKQRIKYSENSTPKQDS
jgi:hypothetical protein